ncbi:erythrocyte membrane protein 1 [Plasmodium falciparum RAJ116]|uniref:Erythrocyte membrane protein 1 n=1 Tax=Plasmodium falciparum RAJ116 TaxID=580058 RepID=A0A0L0CUN4_PLAFA|nr:erythrocyte membrane protein 1 [Plasmodium falciparum RAJ116]
MAPRTRGTTGNKQSARDVLEKIALQIYKKEKKKTIPYERELKGKLSKAEFADRLYKESNGGLRSAPSDACSLEYQYYTNTTIYSDTRRHPCHGRENNRFSESQEYGCSNVYIKGNENKSNCTACVPPRRRHICDQNLEFLDNPHTDDTDDLLGNVLVTAKYEGNYIVSNHPDKNSNGNKSGICTSLARSFADIGDIVRGRDMFKSNKNVEIGLKKVFDKIYDKLGQQEKRYYSDTGNNVDYVKLREAWWTANRDQVWKAITCEAPDKANYFKKKSDGTLHFSSHGKCGHNEGAPPTNLDYVPQFLRWFDEWSEEFCRKKKIKLENVKKACRDEPNNKYCSGDGHDCTKTDLSRNSIFVDLNCPDCEKACENYTKWIEIQRKQFDKQKRKYMNEIDMNTYTSNNENDKKFYENLKDNYSSINTFLELLNNVKQCKGNNNIKNEMNFKNPNKAFGPSGYCEACPIYGVNCTNEKCIPVTEKEWIIKNGLPTDTSTKNLNATNIDMLVNHAIGNAIDNELEKNCTKYGILKGIKKQKWQCQYLNNIDQCKINNVVNSPYFDNKIAFNVLFQRWLKYFVRDHNRLKEKIEVCIKNENGKEDICIKGCKTNCECVGKWLEKKELEWEKIKEHYNQKKSHYGHTIPYWITGFYEKITFPNDFFKALEDVDTINVLDTLKECQDTHCKIEKIRSIDVDFIKKLISWLQNKITVCKNQHDEDNHEYCCDILPKSVDDDEEDDEEVDEEKEESSQTKERNTSPKGGTKSASCVKGACAIVKGVLQQKRNGSIDNCNPKTFNNKDWDCDDKNIDNSHKVVCMPPRRKSICIHNLKLETQTQNQNELREAFIKCSAKETNLLWDKYTKENSTAIKELEKGEIPEGFKKILYYTYGDFRDFCLGTAISEKSDSIEAVKRNMDRVLGKIEDISQDNNRTERQKFWDQYKNDIWKGMLCALTHNLKSEDQQKITDSNIYKVPPEDFAKKPTFLRWLEEWYDDFSNMRQKMMTNMQNKCNENTKGKKDTYNCSECSNICQEYRDYMKKKKHQWDNQKGYYDKEKEILNGKGVIKHAAEKELDNLLKEPYNEITQYCGCDKFNSSSDSKESTYKVPIRGRGESNCEGLYNARKTDNTGSVIKWENTDGVYRFLKNSGLSSSVYIPPRRQKICFKGLDDHKSLQTTKDLRKKLMEVAATEGMNLGEYYKNQNEATKDAEKYAYNVEPCSALKYSFLDFGNIIKGNDNLEPTSNETEKNLNKFFTNLDSSNGKNDINKKRNHFWNENKECFWKAMKCGYKMGRDNGPKDKTIKYSFKELEDCNDVPPDTDNTTDSKDGQFLRWFKEWEEDYCKNREIKVKKLVEDCKNFSCEKIYEDDERKKCNKSCSSYRKFLIPWKDQYENQKKKYENDQISNKYTLHPIAKTIPEAHKYLQKMCNNKCSYVKVNHSSNDIQAFKYPPIEVPDKCSCPVPEYRAPENWVKKISDDVRKKMSEEREKHYNEKDKDEYKEIERKFSEDVIRSRKNKLDKTSKNTESSSNFPYTLNCIERAANELRKDIEKKTKDIKGKLEGNLSEDLYNEHHKNTDIKSTCKVKVINFKYPEKSPCDTKGFPFDENEKWYCNSKHICVPPRRKHMCTKYLETFVYRDINTYEDILEILLITAASEGKNLKENYKGKNNYSNLCDAMKYSFADIGDIVKGRDLLIKNNIYDRIEIRLQTIFNNIYMKKEIKEKNKYKNDFPYYYNLREAWWNVNRKHIWKAMTCEAQENAYFMKTEPDGKGISRLIWSHGKCARDKDPPVDDYIPQRFRWLTEWSEYFCKTQKNEIQKLRDNCDKCTSGTSCTNDDENGKICEKCKETCKEYKNFINIWKSQLETQSTKYNELYKKSNTNVSGTGTTSNDDAMEGSREKRGRRATRTDQDDDNRSIEFLKKVIEKCDEDPSSSEQYLDKTANCPNIKFTKNGDAPGTAPSGASGSATGDDRNDAFENPPKDYKDSCNCKAPEPLDNCPDGNTNTYEKVCKSLSATNVCTRTNFNNNDDYWTVYDVRESTEKNKGVLVPPRRRKLCIRNITSNLNNIDNKGNFKKKFLQYAYTQGHYLSNIYKHDNENAIDAMRYSFYDYGDIVKGTDIMDNVKNMKDELNRLLKKNGDTGIPDRSKNWWDENKRHIWNAMLCGYQKGKNNTHSETLEQTWCDLPTEDDTLQFLRWFQEWAETFCTGRNELYNQLQSICASTKCNTESGTIESVNCETACATYRNYITRKKKEYLSLKGHYDMNYKGKTLGKIEAHEYFQNKCSNSKCKCISNHTNNENNRKEPYETFDNTELRDICNCKKIEKTIPAKANEAEEKGPPSSHETLPSHPLTNDQTDVTGNILSTTIPVGIALALGSIAFLFIKKKPKTPVDLIRVLDIHKGDYGTPTPKSSNRYIPYASDTYKGKTYIYMEGDSDSGHYYEDTTDITSSESEYEEMDINDIYPYTSPKYKTLIEVVLEPSKSNGNTLGDDMLPTTNTFTDEEWNELKHDFISQYVVREPLDIPQYDVLTDLPMNIVGNVLDDGMDEKPFITSIHDRDLYTGEEISYNIHMSTNSMDDPKYVSNNVYSGIDLINDSLSGNKHIDIYDELLKRKENELFGTNHVKHTSIHSVAKNTNSDPIMNQLDLLHKWLDRHRDMCNTWNTKEELLDKLNEQWNKDNDGGNVPSDNHVLNTDVSIEIDIDENKGKKEFSNMDINVDTPTMDNILDDLETYNEPFYDIYEDDVYYDVNDENPSMDDISMDHNKVDVPKKVHVEMKILNNTSNGSLEPEFPISDVWNI